MIILIDEFHTKYLNNFGNILVKKINNKIIASDITQNAQGIIRTVRPRDRKSHIVGDNS